MSEPTWQPNYVDLSEGNTMRLGASCTICGARYATPIETIDPLLVTAALPGSPLERDLSELRFQFFTRFDAAFRDLCVRCYRCGRTACPECWDEDNRMCGECVSKRGLARSPHHGLPVTGPLVDGRLERIASGQYAEVGRPPWLSQLLDAQGALVAAAGPNAASSLPQGFIAPQIARRTSQGPTPASNSGFGIPTSVTFGGEGSGSLVEEPTLRHSAVDDLPPSGRRLSGGPALSLEMGDFHTPEGTATSHMVTCPRCGTANYDFVTRCTACQLQLIQICQVCDKLNPGHVHNCEQCGAPLDQPKGWSGVQAAIQAVPPQTVREIHNGTRTTGAPVRKPTPPVQRAPRSSRRLRALFGIASESGAGPAPSYGASPDDSEMPQIMAIAERFLGFALAALLLLLVGGIAAAEVSLRADHFIASVLHIDVRETISQFLQHLQFVFQQNHG